MREDKKIYVCFACGKTSDDKYGTLATHGWDVSCYMNSELVDKDDIVFDDNGRASWVKDKKL